MATIVFTRKEINADVDVLRNLFMAVKNELPKVNQAGLRDQFYKMQDWNVLCDDGG